MKFQVPPSKAELSAALGGVMLDDSNVGRALLDRLLSVERERVLAVARERPGTLKRPRNGNPEAMAAFDEAIRALLTAGAGEDSVRTTVPTKDSSTNPNYQKLPIYDHALISSETSYALSGNPMTLAGSDFGVSDFDNDSWWKANGWSCGDIIKAVSDHRPIWIRLVSGAADLDPRPTPP